MLGDGDSAAHLVAEHFPALGGLPVSHLVGGADHDAYAVGEDWLVRFPRRAKRVAWLERELEVLDLLGQTVTSGVPRPELIGERTDSYPFLPVAYRRIIGDAADARSLRDPTNLASDLGRLLDAVHRVDPERIPPTPDRWEQLGFDYERARLIGCAGTVRRLLPPDLAAEAEPYLTGQVLTPPRVAAHRFIHGDVCPDHVIVDPGTGRLSGLIDFTDAMVADPVHDFVGLIGLAGRPFINQVLRTYSLPLGEAFPETLQWFSRTLTLRWLADAADDSPQGVAKHQRWVRLAFDSAQRHPPPGRPRTTDLTTDTRPRRDAIVRETVICKRMRSSDRVGLGERGLLGAGPM